MFEARFQGGCDIDDFGCSSVKLPCGIVFPTNFKNASACGDGLRQGYQGWLYNDELSCSLEDGSFVAPFFRQNRIPTWRWFEARRTKVVVTAMICLVLLRMVRLWHPFSAKIASQRGDGLRQGGQKWL
jgi:hypothetical protein